MPKVSEEFGLREPRLNRIVCCEDLNFFWDESELKDLIKMWEMELSIDYMSNHFNGRDPDEIVVGLLHLARQGKIERRKDGLF